MAIKNGFFKHHTEDCDIELKSETENSRSYWCKTHGQWAYEIPIRVVYHWEDGSTSEIEKSGPRGGTEAAPK